jgi:hypothetical protein
MLLTVFERANLLNILPHEGDFRTLKCVRTLRESVSLTEEENALYTPQLEDGHISWRTVDDVGNDIPQEADIVLSKMGRELIRDELEKLSNQKRLKEEHLSLYEKFFESED